MCRRRGDGGLRAVHRDIVCSGTDQTTTVGSGDGTTGITSLTVQSSAVIDTGDAVAISLGSGAPITLQPRAVVQNTAVGTSGPDGDGGNTIEFGSNTVLTIGAGAKVLELGTEGTAEAINPTGSGNTIINNGTISSNGGGAAIWFQSSAAGTNTVVNGPTGVISYKNDPNGAILGVSGSMGVNFTNQGQVQGSLNFADGTNVLNVYTGSSISGSVNGAGGNNTLTLNSASGTDSDTFGTPVNGFQTLINQSGTWTIGNSLAGAGLTKAEVAGGTLILGADFHTFTGSTTVDAAGTLQAPAAFAPTAITDNGLVRFAEPSDDSYSGTLSGSGGIEKTGAGVLTLATDQAITGTTTISGGTLRLGNGGATGSLNGNGPTGPIVDNGALVVDRSNAMSLSGAISGSGSLTQAGSGTTVLTGDNSYAGGTTIAAGTLQLGNGGTSGSVVGNIVDNAALVSDRSDTLALAGTISGSGSLTQAGSGTTVLTGNNTYAGGTTIAAGTLQLGNGGTGGSVTGPIVDNGMLAINRSDTSVLANTVSGSGALAQIGSGTTVLTADNTYTGGTTIAAGTLQLGNGGTSGSVVGNIVDNGALVIDRSNASTIAGLVSGSGSLTQAGSGTTVLTADNTYTGGTTIATGTLQLGDGGTSGSVAGNIVDNGTLVVDHSDTLQMAGAISGSGGLQQAGSGTTVLSGSNSYTGTTLISAGTLQAGAAKAFSASSAHVVAAGATLDTGGFNQTVAALTNAGTVNLLSAVAGSTLTVTGAYVGNNGVLNLGTVLAGSTSLSDMLVLNGSAASASGSTTVRITNLGGLGALTTGNGIEVVSAINGATTTAQTTKSAFTLANGHVDAGAYEYKLYAADASGNGQNWYLRSASTTPVNPVNPVNPVDPVGPVAPPVAVPTYRTEVPLLAALPSQLRQGDLAMLGNLHRRVGDELAPVAGNGSAAADGSTSAPGSNERQAWARAIYTDLDLHQGGVADATSSGHLSGLQAGTDLLAMNGWRAGIYVGSLDGSAQVSGNAGGLWGPVGGNQLQSRYLGAYATWMDGHGLYVDSVLQGGNHDITVQPDDDIGVSTKARSLTASVEAGKSFPLAENWMIEPQAQLIYQRSNIDNLMLSDALVRQDANGGWIGRLGVRVKGDIATDAGRLQPYARFNVYVASGGSDVATFINPAASTPIASATGYTTTELAAGATLALTPNCTLYGEVGQLYNAGGQSTVKSSVLGSLGLRVSW